MSMSHGMVLNQGTPARGIVTFEGLLSRLRVRRLDVGGITVTRV